MKQNNSNLLYHLVAFITVAISTDLYAPFQYRIHDDADGES